MPNPRNLATGLDLFGSLIAPREDGEDLPHYQKRVRQAAEAMTQRDTASGDKWREAREQELEGHLGKEVYLEPAPEDEGLLRRAEEQLFTYDRLSEEEGPFRWPEQNAAGLPPLYNWTRPQGGGVAAPRSLRMTERENGLIYHEPGYVWAEDQLWYVPARPERATFPLPTGTTETVVIPWHIESRHAHRIEVVDEQTLRLVADGHTHEIERTEGGWTQNSGPHTHEMRPIQMEGPAFLETRPSVPRTGEPAQAGDTLPGTDSVNERVAWPVRYPEAILAETDDGAHSHEVDPHEYWSGNFYLYGGSHSHKVEDWTVQEAAGHGHSITKPSIPGRRPLWPRLTKHEGTPLREETDDPYQANLRVEKGWTVAKVPEGFSEELVLRFDTEEEAQVPRPPVEDGMTVGLGPDLQASRVVIAHVAEADLGRGRLRKDREIFASSPPAVQCRSIFQARRPDTCRTTWGHVLLLLRYFALHQRDWSYVS